MLNIISTSLILDESEMSVAIKTYHSIREITDTMDKEIADSKSKLGNYLRRLDDIRAFAEKSRRIRETVMKLTGKKNLQNETLGEIDAEGLKIILDANAFHELTAIEDAVRSHQEYLQVLQRAQEALKPLDQLSDTEGLEFMVIEKRRVPQRILIKTI